MIYSTMKKYLILTLLLLLPGIIRAQQNGEEDPFKRDPIFNKSLEELLGGEEDEDRKDEDTDAGEAFKRLSTRGIDLSGAFEAGPYYSNVLFSQYPNLSAIHFNRVNGLFFGLKKERMQWYRSGGFLNIPRIQPHGFIGYGTASKQWDYAIGLERLFGENKRVLIGGEFHRAAATEDYWRSGLIETSLTSFFAGYDYLDYYQMEGFGAYALVRTERWFEGAFSYNSDTFNALERNNRYSMFGYKNTVMDNPGIDRFSDEIDLDRYSISLAFNPKRLLLADKFTFSASAGVELADNDASDESYRYDKYWSELQMFYNFEPGSVLKWRVKAGRIEGEAPDFKKFYLGGIGSLRGSPYKIFAGNEMVLSNLEVQFGAPKNGAGSWLNEYNVHLLAFLDSGWTDGIDLLMDAPGMAGSRGAGPDQGQFSIPAMQHDLGIGLGTDAFRFELAWPMETFEKTPVLWFRLNPTF